VAQYSRELGGREMRDGWLNGEMGGPVEIGDSVEMGGSVESWMAQ
jgi:hypothetical protein